MRRFYLNPTGPATKAEGCHAGGFKPRGATTRSIPVVFTCCFRGLPVE